MVRDPRVELFRCLMGFGITLLHAVIWSPVVERGVDNLCGFCVPGFVLITAFFGVRCSPSKMIRLIGTAVVCACVANSFALLIDPHELISIYFLIKVFRSLSNYWYLWAYVGLMFFAPLIEPYIQTVKRSRNDVMKSVVLISFLMWCWGYVSSLPPCADLFPRHARFDELGVGTVLCVYLIGRLLFQGNVHFKVNTWMKLGVLIVDAIFVYMGFRHNHCITTFVLAWIGFGFVRDIKIPVAMEKCIFAIAPSVFSVYLLQIPLHGVVLTFQLYLQQQHTLPVVVSNLFTSIVLFALCLLLDIPRRILCKLLKPTLMHIYNKLDVGFDGFTSRLTRLTY